MGTSGWDKFKTRRNRLRAVSAKERAHIDQASQEAVRLLIVFLLLILATYYINLIIADCCFPCTRRMLPRRFYSPSCRQGPFSETRGPEGRDEEGRGFCTPPL